MFMNSRKYGFIAIKKCDNFITKSQISEYLYYNIYNVFDMACDQVEKYDYSEHTCEQIIKNLQMNFSFNDDVVIFDKLEFKNNNDLLTKFSEFVGENKTADDLFSIPADDRSRKIKDLFQQIIQIKISDNYVIKLKDKILREIFSSCWKEYHNLYQLMIQDKDIRFIIIFKNNCHSKIYATRHGSNKLAIINPLKYIKERINKKFKIKKSLIQNYEVIL